VVDLRSAGQDSLGATPHDNPDFGLWVFLPRGDKDRCDQEVVTNMAKLREENAHRGEEGKRMNEK
jgi:hypothetical protein